MGEVIEEGVFSNPFLAYRPEKPEKEPRLPDQQGLSEFFAEFLADVQELAGQYILSFFEGRELYCGGEIDRKLLLNANYITLVLNTDICIGADRAHLALDPVCGDCESSLTVTPSIRRIVDFHNHCIDRGIPKCFRGGLMLMYLELVEGLDV